MKESFENKIIKDGLPKTINLNVLKYFWQASPISGYRTEHTPKFLRKIGFLQKFTENELRLLTKFLHIRTFSPQEIIFNQNDTGTGFYFIYSGRVDIWTAQDEAQLSDNISTESTQLTIDQQIKHFFNHVVTLEKYEYFGEMALLEEQSKRNAMAISKTEVTLFGIFKPDIDELTLKYPVVAAKFIEGLAKILTTRIKSMGIELKSLQNKVKMQHDK
jgi:CRP/FNR family transcriptional regulator, cyclic AMP receptor protein